MSKPLLAIIELRWWGHHPSFFKKFIQMALDVGFNVIAFCPVEADEIVKEFNGLQSDVRLVRIPNLYQLLNEQPSWVKYFRIEGLWRWWTINKLLHSTEKEKKIIIDHVFICMLDDYVVGWVWPIILEKVFKYPWSGLYLWPWRNDERYGGAAPSLTPHRYKWQFARAKNCNYLFSIDEYFILEQTKKYPHLYSDKWLNFPEYEEKLHVDNDFSVAQEIRQKADGRKIIGLIGIMEVRKGIHTLLDVAKQSLEKDWFFVFVGTGIDASRDEFDFFYKKVKNLELTNCFFHFKYLATQNDFYSVMSTFDIVFLAYIRFYYPSGNLAYASLLQKPVIVTKGGVMARRVEDYNLGLTVKEDSPVDCIKAISSLLSDDYQDKMRNEEYYTLHSEQALKLAFKKILVRLGA